jgi:hypothetical protein
MYIRKITVRANGLSILVGGLLMLPADKPPDDLLNDRYLCPGKAQDKGAPAP